MDEIVVVEGAYELETDARVVRCAEWQRGMGASLRCGLEALPADAEAAVVVLADGPDLAPEAIDRVITAWRGGAGEALAASYGGVRGHPVLLGAVSLERRSRRGRPRARLRVRPPATTSATRATSTTPEDLRPREA